MTWRDDVAAVDEAVRAGWEILDGFRSIAFTGAVRFALLPAASVYLERGRIYYAERESDPDVADRLVAAGGLRPRDLASGVIVLGAEGSRGDIDHLGHLFERVPLLDRQRVMLALELVTEETVSWIAGQTVSSTTTEPYVYHPSGVHRWYEPTVPAAPAFVPPTTRPADRQHSPVDLPRVRIAWPSPPPPPPPASPDAASAAPIDTPADPAPAEPAEPAAPTSEVHDSRGDASAPPRRWQTPEMVPRDVPDDEPDLLEDFTVVWPSGDLDDDEREHEVVAAHAPVVAFDRFDDPHEPPDEFDIVIRGDVDADTAEVGIEVRQAIASVRTDAAQPRRPTPVAEAGDHQRRTETESERHVRDRGAESDDDPFRSDRRLAESDRAISIEERRTALQRLIDAMRGR